MTGAVTVTGSHRGRDPGARRHTSRHPPPRVTEAPFRAQSRTPAHRVPEHRPPDAERRLPDVAPPAGRPGFRTRGVAFRTLRVRTARPAHLTTGSCARRTEPHPPTDPPHLVDTLPGGCPALRTRPSGYPPAPLQHPAPHTALPRPPARPTAHPRTRNQGHAEGRGATPGTPETPHPPRPPATRETPRRAPAPPGATRGPRRTGCGPRGTPPPAGHAHRATRPHLPPRQVSGPRPPRTPRTPLRHHRHTRHPPRTGTPRPGATPETPPTPSPLGPVAPPFGFP